MMKNRIKYIDRMKGFAILLVVMGHVYLFSLGQSRCVMYDVIGSFHMPLFMFLSGMVAVKGITPPYWTLSQLRHKLLGLLIPMSVFGVLFSMTFGPIDTFAEFCDRVMGFVNSPNKLGYWYLMSLAVFYLSLQLFRINKSNSKVVEVFIAFGTWLAFYCGWKWTAQTHDPLCLLNCGNFYFFFILGVFCSKYGLIDKMMRHNILFTMGLMGYMVLFDFVAPFHAFGSIVKHIVLPLCALLVVIPLFVKREHESSFVECQLEYIGKNSLDIYVLHYFLITNINLDVVDEWLQMSGNLFLSIMMTSFLSIVIAYVCVGVGNALRQSIHIRRYVLFR